MNYIHQEGVLKTGDRLILSSGNHKDESTLLLDESRENLDDWILNGSGDEDQSRSIFLKRE